MRIFPVVGIAALAVGFYHASGGGGFQPPVAQAAVNQSREGAKPEVGPLPAATPERIAAVQAAFRQTEEAPEVQRAAERPSVIRIRRGSETEAVRVKRVAAPVRAPSSTPDADAVFTKIFDAAARGEVLVTTASSPVPERTEPVEFTVVEVAAPGAIDAAVDSALDGALDVREVIGDGVNMRSGPGVQHPVVGKLQRGEMAEVLQEQSGWAELRLASGESAWMAANFLR